MKATLRGTEIYYDIAGMQLVPTGKTIVERPVIFLLHGGPGGDHFRYKKHSLEFQEVAQLVFIDNRGCGRSKKTKKTDYTLENNIEDIEALRQHLGLNKICVLGTSYGGMVAQGYAIRYSRYIDKLILVATAASYRFIDEAKEYLQQHGTPQQIAVAEHLWKGNFKNSKEVAQYFRIMDPLYSMQARQQKKGVYAKPITAFSTEALNQGFRECLREFDYIPHLKKIRCPTLVLAGEHDWICQPSQSKIIAANIPNARLKIFKKSSHGIAVDVHQQYIKIIKEFL